LNSIFSITIVLNKSSELVNKTSYLFSKHAQTPQLIIKDIYSENSRKYSIYIKLVWGIIIMFSEIFYTNAYTQTHACMHADILHYTNIPRVVCEVIICCSFWQLWTPGWHATEGISKKMARWSRLKFHKKLNMSLSKHYNLKYDITSKSCGGGPITREYIAM